MEKERKKRKERFNNPYIQKFFYSASFAAFFIILVALALVIAGDHFYQSIKERRLWNVVIVGAVYVITFMTAMIIYAARQFKTRAELARVPWEWNLNGIGATRHSVEVDEDPRSKRNSGLPLDEGTDKNSILNSRLRSRWWPWRREKVAQAPSHLDTDESDPRHQAKNKKKQHRPDKNVYAGIGGIGMGKRMGRVVDGAWHRSVIISRESQPRSLASDNSQFYILIDPYVSVMKRNEGQLDNANTDGLDHSGHPVSSQRLDHLQHRQRYARAWHNHRRGHPLRTIHQATETEAEQREPVWGVVEHPGWSSPEAKEIPNLHFPTVIGEMASLIEAKAVATATSAVHGKDSDHIDEKAGDKASEDDPVPDLAQTVTLLRRSPGSTLRAYIARLLDLGVLPSTQDDDDTSSRTSVTSKQSFVQRPLSRSRPSRTASMVSSSAAASFYSARRKSTGTTLDDGTATPSVRRPSVNSTSSSSLSADKAVERSGTGTSTLLQPRSTDTAPKTGADALDPEKSSQLSEKQDEDESIEKTAEAFLHYYERARYSGEETSEAEFRKLMGLFGEVMRAIQPPATLPRGAGKS